MSDDNEDKLVETVEKKLRGEPEVETLHGTKIGEHTDLLPSGMQKDYIVMTAEERAKGFVRPIRYSYIHVGKRPRFPTRDLTEEEQKRFNEENDEPYVKWEPYPAGYRGSATGRFWTAKELVSGCGGKTKMSIPLAETYARSPSFYGKTFCCSCREHFDVGENGEFVWEGTDEKVGT